MQTLYLSEHLKVAFFMQTCCIYSRLDKQIIQISNNYTLLITNSASYCYDPNHDKINCIVWSQPVQHEVCHLSS